MPNGAGALVPEHGCTAHLKSNPSKRSLQTRLKGDHSDLRPEVVATNRSCPSLSPAEAAKQRLEHRNFVVPVLFGSLLYSFLMCATDRQLATEQN